MVEYLVRGRQVSSERMHQKLRIGKRMPASAVVLGAYMQDMAFRRKSKVHRTGRLKAEL